MSEEDRNPPPDYNRVLDSLEITLCDNIGSEAHDADEALARLILSKLEELGALRCLPGRPDRATHTLRAIIADCVANELRRMGADMAEQRSVEIWEAWNTLNSTIVRLLCAQPHHMTEAAADLQQARDAMQTVLRKNAT